MSLPRSEFWEPSLPAAVSSPAAVAPVSQSLVTRTAPSPAASGWLRREPGSYRATVTGQSLRTCSGAAALAARPVAAVFSRRM